MSEIPTGSDDPMEKNTNPAGLDEKINLTLKVKHTFLRCANGRHRYGKTLIEVINNSLPYNLPHSRVQNPVTPDFSFAEFSTY